MYSLHTRIVKRLAALTLSATVAVLGVSRSYGQVAITPSTATASAGNYQTRSFADLQELTKPIALYPDAVLAQLLVASTYPTDVVKASQFLQAGGDPSRIATTGSDVSVQGLVQTPDVLKLLAGDVNWMNQLGEAFLNQQKDLLGAVQSLRVQARLAGTLVSNPYQQVLAQEDVIQIVPVNPRVIYIPRYDPCIVFLREPRIEVFEPPCITFSDGIIVGIWLQHDFDWCDRCIYFGTWGCERPWWHGRHEGEFVDYVHSRPGVYVNNITNVTNITNITNVTNVRTSNVWVRDGHKEGPAHVSTPVVRHEVPAKYVHDGGTTIGHGLYPAPIAPRIPERWRETLPHPTHFREPIDVAPVRPAVQPAAPVTRPKPQPATKPPHSTTNVPDRGRDGQDHRNGK